MLRREFLGGMSMLAVFGAQESRAVVKTNLPPEGVEFHYRVIYSGHEIGTQTVKIKQHDKLDHVIVEHRIKAEIRIFFAVAYSLDHTSTETWDGFTLRSIRSETIENDQRFLIEGSKTDNGFRIRNGSGEQLVAREAVSCDSFWLAAAINSANLINTRTGEAAAPVVKKLGNDRWHLKAQFDHGEIDAKMRFDGEFLSEAIIDSGGHTVTIERL